jgi:hypothetical protein
MMPRIGTETGLEVARRSSVHFDIFFAAPFSVWHSTRPSGIIGMFSCVLSRYSNGPLHPISEHDHGKGRGSHQGNVDQEEFPTEPPFADNNCGGEAKDNAKSQPGKVPPATGTDKAAKYTGTAAVENREDFVHNASSKASQSANQAHLPVQRGSDYQIRIRTRQREGETGYLCYTANPKECIGDLGGPRGAIWRTIMSRITAFPANVWAD